MRRPPRVLDQARTLGSGNNLFKTNALIQGSRKMKFWTRHDYYQNEAEQVKENPICPKYSGYPALDIGEKEEPEERLYFGLSPWA